MTGVGRGRGHRGAPGVTLSPANVGLISPADSVGETGGRTDKWGQFVLEMVTKEAKRERFVRSEMCLTGKTRKNMEQPDLFKLFLGLVLRSVSRIMVQN